MTTDQIIEHDHSRRVRRCETKQHDSTFHFPRLPIFAGPIAESWMRFAQTKKLAIKPEHLLVLRFVHFLPTQFRIDERALSLRIRNRVQHFGVTERGEVPELHAAALPHELS